MAPGLPANHRCNRHEVNAILSSEGSVGDTRPILGPDLQHLRLSQDRHWVGLADVCPLLEASRVALQAGRNQVLRVVIAPVPVQMISRQSVIPTRQRAAPMTWMGTGPDLVIKGDTVTVRTVLVVGESMTSTGNDDVAIRPQVSRPIRAMPALRGAGITGRLPSLVVQGTPSAGLRTPRAVGHSASPGWISIQSLLVVTATQAARMMGV